MYSKTYDGKVQYIQKVLRREAYLIKEEKQKAIYKQILDAVDGLVDNPDISLIDDAMGNIFKFLEGVYWPERRFDAGIAREKLYELKQFIV